MKNIQILGIIDGAPFDYRTWSGSSYYFFSALKKHDCLCDVLSAQPAKPISDLYKLLSFCPNLSKWKFKYHINVRYFMQMTKTVLRKMKMIDDEKYNVILQIGAWYDLTKRKDKITVSYQDGNLFTRLNNPYGYPDVSRKYIKQGLDYEKNLYGKMDHLFAMSKWLASSFVRDFGIDPKKITPVGAGINLPYVRKIENKSYARPKILFVGKEFDRKGGKQLLDAFKIVKREIRNATLTLVGPQIKNVPEGVECKGYFAKNTNEGIENLLNEYSSSSVFVMPSLYEPFGIVLAEAMAHKLPCVGTNICAIPEIIDDGKTGFLVPPLEAKVLASKLIELLKQPLLMKALGDSGYKKYSEWYTWEKVTEKIITTTSKCL